MTKRNQPIVDYYIVRGRQDGPIVLLTAGIHGTEIAGVIAANELRTLKISRGKLIVVPLVNVRAYQKRTRGNPDLNRTYPRTSKERARHGITRQVFQLARKHHPLWCIDLHEANGFYRLDHSKLGQTIIVYPNRKTAKIADRIVARINRSITSRDRRFSVRQSILPGSFRTATGKLLNCHAVTVETSMQQPRKLRVQYQTMIVLALLKEIGLL